uniref:Glutathione S-transferase GST-7 n=1 Tax=Diaphorina citri TaxID=121845 RepID=A0A482LU55_DIACI|nr:glutathione S-transferase GST-7 [Diaphorina citri]
MTIDFYYVPGSAPCRAVQLAAAQIGVPLNLKHTDLMKGEHLTPEFLRLNPQHTVPTMDDNGYTLSESRAIIAYLAEQYGKDDSLYPKDPKARGIVNQRLYFDIGTLYQRFADYFYPHCFGGAPLDAEKAEKLDQALGFLNTFLASSPWVAGDNITIADCSIVASLSTIEIVGFDLSKHSNVVAYLAKAKTSLKDYEEANNKGTLAFKGLVDHLTKK